MAVERETYLLSLKFLDFKSETHAALFRPGQILQMIVTNLRNRPLSSTDIRSLIVVLPGLYNSHVTGFHEFPMIPLWAKCHSRLMFTPFINVNQRENTRPSRLQEEPAGLLRLAPHPRRIQSIVTAGHPEKADVGVLLGDNRNCIRLMKIGNKTGTRVISPVYLSDGTEHTNRWRVSHYGADGNILMSVICKFSRLTELPKSAQRQGQKRKVAEDGSSSRLSQPEKRLRI